MKLAPARHRSNDDIPPKPDIGIDLFRMMQT